MDINNENMQALFKAYDTSFTRAMRDATGRVGTHGLLLNEIAISVPSTTGTSVHSWLNQLASMREWLGDRLVRELDFGQLKVTNRDFENTIGVGVNDIEDDQYGLYTPLFQAMGDACGRLPVELAIQALVAQKPWADGVAFFAKNRKLASRQTTTITNATDGAFNEANVRAALVAISSYMLAADVPAAVSPRILLVGPALLDQALWIFERELVVAQGGGGTVSNTMKGRLIVRESNLLVGDHANKWFILGEKSGIKGVAVQERKKPQLVKKDKPDDDNVFWKNKIYYGAHARYEGFGTLPFLAYAGGLTDVPDATGAFPGEPVVPEPPEET